jgi:hypothetical protein
MKLRAFQGILSHASLMLTVSSEDNNYLSRKFPNVRVEYVPSFHKDDDINSIPGSGDFALYHGNLSVAENEKAAEYLIKNVFHESNTRFIIAGLNPPKSLETLVFQNPNITMIANPTEPEMFDLIKIAQINILVTFQPTGLKLKLLNALFNGRHCLVNPGMVIGTELGNLCEIADDAKALKQKVAVLMGQPFDEERINQRRKILLKWHSNKENCKRLMNLLSLFPTHIVS